jgi:hypothetical protein
MLAKRGSIAAAMPNFEAQIAPFKPAQLPESLHQHPHPCIRNGTRGAGEYADLPHYHLRSLCFYRNRPRDRCSADQRDKLPPPHAGLRT